MPGYDIFLSNGELLTTIEQKTIDRRISSSFVLIGQGVPQEWQTIDQNLVWMLENFSHSAPPPKPLVGQKWHDKCGDTMNVYTGRNWRPLLTAADSASAEFNMLTSARNIDFTVAARVPIFSATDPALAYLPISLLLVPSGPITATTSPTINVSVVAPSDIIASASVEIKKDGKFVQLHADEAVRMISAADHDYGAGLYGTGSYSLDESTVSINITTAATGGELRFDAFLYGFVVGNPKPLPLPSEGVFGIGIYGRGPYSL